MPRRPGGPGSKEFLRSCDLDRSPSGLQRGLYPTGRRAATSEAGRARDRSLPFMDPGCQPRHRPRGRVAQTAGPGRQAETASRARMTTFCRMAAGRARVFDPDHVLAGNTRRDLFNAAGEQRRGPMRLRQKRGYHMDSDFVARVKGDPQFQELTSKRSRFAWILSGAMLAIYFGFIFVIAFAPKALGVPLGTGVTTVGIPVGLFIIVSAFVLTGIYVRRANTEFDAIAQQIIERAK